MSFSLFARVLGVYWFVAAVFASAVYGQSGFAPLGNEYSLTGLLPGDQTHPQISIKPGGGYIVWEDNGTDGSGLGISAMRVDGSLSGSLVPFRVNQIGSGDQERAQVAVLHNGGAAFIRQSGRSGDEQVYARFRSPTNTWLTGDLLVNTYTNGSQASPGIATLANGNLIAVWASFNQRSSGSRNDVYGRLFTPAGQKIGAEFSINEFSQFNQRSPVVAALSGGGFVVAWISEQQRSVMSAGSNSVTRAEAGSQFPETPQWTAPSVDVYARLYDANGTPLGAEFVVNTSTNVCASPSVTASADGGFVIAWMEKDVAVLNNGWDIYVRSFTLAGVGTPQRHVNTQLYGDQYAPRIGAANGQLLVVWTSLSQDGSREGVFGQFMESDATPVGGEFRVNTTSIGAQMHQAVAADGSGQLLVLWTSFGSISKGFDLYAQRYAGAAQELSAPAAPTVSVVSSNALRVSWAPVAGLSVSNYEVYADGTATPTAVVVSNSWTMSGLALNSTHTFRLAYVLADGRRSPLSDPASGTTRDVSNDPVDPAPGDIVNPIPASGSNTIQKLPFPPSGGLSSSNATRLSFAAVQGGYNGLFYNSEQVISEGSGFITIKATAKGTFSAKLQLGGLTYSFSGMFNSAGRWGPMPVGGKKGATPLMVELQLDLYGNDQITGRVSTAKWSATLLAHRAGFGKTSQTPWAGTYTFVIPGDVTSANSPAGSGVGSLRVDAAGNVQLSGTLADGSAFSQKTVLSKSGVWPFYSSLYGGKGAALGWIELGSVASYDLYGPVVWIKPAVPGTALYPSGFTNQTFMAGSTFQAPVASQWFDNVKLVLSGGNVDGSLEESIGMQGKKVIAQSGGLVSLSLTPKTGLFKGTISEPGTGQNLPFQGVVFQKYNIGLGYFLGADQSGNLYLGPNP